jgi:hypothetical protein
LNRFCTYKFIKCHGTVRLLRTGIDSACAGICCHLVLIPAPDPNIFFASMYLLHVCSSAPQPIPRKEKNSIHIPSPRLCLHHRRPSSSLSVGRRLPGGCSTTFIFLPLCAVHFPPLFTCPIPCFSSPPLSFSKDRLLHLILRIFFGLRVIFH